MILSIKSILDKTYSSPKIDENFMYDFKLDLISSNSLSFDVVIETSSLYLDLK